MQMMAAEVLGIEPSRLNPLVADTETLPYNQTTGGLEPHSQRHGGDRSRRRCGEPVEGTRAALWNVTTEQVDYKNGVALNLAGDDQMTLAEICAAAEKREVRYQGEPT